MNNEITIDGIVYVRKDVCSCPLMKKDNKNIGKKYRFTGETLNYKGHTLHRIIASKDFGNIKKGDLGGWIGAEENLSQEGDCWVYKNAKVYEYARVYGDAKVFGNAEVHSGACVYDNAKVYEYARVYGDAEVFDNAEVFGNAEVSDNAWVYDNVKVCGNARLGGHDGVN